MAAIRFFSEEIKFKLPSPRKTSSWIKTVVIKEKKQPGAINYIFCSDEYLLQINQQYLNHDTFTDIVTFDSSEEKDVISGEIYISVDRIHDNAQKFNNSFDEELHRVIIHGVLHLIGYSDKGATKKTLMRRKEDTYLSLR